MSNESMIEVEKEYIELSDKYVNLAERYEKLSNKFLREQEKNLELINKNLEITQNTDKISQDYINLVAENEKLKSYTTHGARVELEDGQHFFIPFMNNNLSGMKNIINRPVKLQYTFNPQGVLDWVSLLEETLKEHRPIEESIKNETKA